MVEFSLPIKSSFEFTLKILNIVLNLDFKSKGAFENFKFV